MHYLYESFVVLSVLFCALLLFDCIFHTAPFELATLASDRGNYDTAAHTRLVLPSPQHAQCTIGWLIYEDCVACERVSVGWRVLTDYHPVGHKRDRFALANP